MAEKPANAPQFVITKWNAVALWSWEMEQETCAICKSSLMEKCVQCQANEDESPTCNPIFGVCNHAFHQHCIERWVKTSPTCPLCNAPWSPAPRGLN